MNALATFFSGCFGILRELGKSLKLTTNNWQIANNDWAADQKKSIEKTPNSEWIFDPVTYEIKHKSEQ